MTGADLRLTPLIENKAASIRDHATVELTGTSVPLDLPTNGRPEPRPSFVVPLLGKSLPRGSRLQPRSDIESKRPSQHLPFTPGGENLSTTRLDPSPVARRPLLDSSVTIL